MNEIDDEYKNNEESLDSRILEEFGKGKSNEEILKNYLGELKRLREEREKKYVKYLKEKKKKVWEKKIEKEKKEDYKHLEVEHFDFEFSKKERFLIWFDSFYFNLKRAVIRRLWDLIPAFLIYRYYKFVKEIKRVFENLAEFYSNTKEKLIRGLIKFGILVWKSLKALGKWSVNFFKLLLKKMVFWKKNSSEEGERGGLEKEGSEKGASERSGGSGEKGETQG